MPFNPSALSGNLEILSPTEAAEVERSRGEWAAVAKYCDATLADAPIGSAIRIDALGLTDKDFTDDDGDVNYSGLANALRPFGLTLKPTVDDSRMVKVPADREQRIADWKEKAEARKAAAKAAKTK